MTTDSHRYSCAHEAWASGARVCDECSCRVAHRIVRVQDMRGRWVKRAAPGCEVLHTRRQPVSACPAAQAWEART